MFDTETYYELRDYGWDAASARGVGGFADLDSFDEAVFHGAFDDALDSVRVPMEPTPDELREVSDAVHEGIRAYWQDELDNDNVC